MFVCLCVYVCGMGRVCVYGMGHVCMKCVCIVDVRLNLFTQH